MAKNRFISVRVPVAADCGRVVLPPPPRCRHCSAGLVVLCWGFFVGCGLVAVFGLAGGVVRLLELVRRGLCGWRWRALGGMGSAFFLFFSCGRTREIGGTCWGFLDMIYCKIAHDLVLWFARKHSYNCPSLLRLPRGWAGSVMVAFIKSSKPSKPSWPRCSSRLSRYSTRPITTPPICAPS